MKYSIVIILLILSLFESQACSCGRVSTFKGLKGADLVFTGKVIKMNKVSITDTLGTVHAGTDSARLITKDYQVIEFTFKVKKMFKGRLKTREVIITTTGGGADCGNYFYEDKKYLVYAYTTDFTLSFSKPQKRTPFLTTSICTRTKVSKKMWPQEWLIMSISRIFRKDQLVPPLPYFE